MKRYIRTTFPKFTGTMKRLFILFTVCLFNYSVQHVSAQEMQWVKQLGGPYTDTGYRVAMDDNGNSYSTGWYNLECDFDPGQEVYQLESNGSYDGYVCKLNSEGELEWAFNFGGPNFDAGRAIAIDSEGNCLVFGNFIGTVDFNPGNETETLTSAGGSAVSIVKLSPDGEFIWARAYTGTGGASIYAVSLDSDNNIYCAGRFNGSIDFDPGTSPYPLTSNGNNADIFVSKLNSNGNFIWAKRIGGISSDQAQAIAVDNNQNVYVGGEFRGTVDFDPGTGTFNLSSNSAIDDDGFVVRLDSGGNFVWAKSIAGSGLGSVQTLGIDNQGAICVYGAFSGNAVFDPGGSNLTLSTEGGTDMFLCKLTPAGNVIWGKSWGSTGYDLPGDMKLDNFGNIYAIGDFEETLFIGGIESLQLVSAGDNDMFIIVIDQNGDFIWSKRMGGPGYENARGIALDSNGSFVVVGNFSLTAEFNDAPSAELTSLGMSDIFVVKHQMLPLAIGNYTLDHDLSIYPNPTAGNLTIDIGQSYSQMSIRIINPIGQTIYDSIFPSGSQFQLNFDGAPGIYFVQITDGLQTVTSKIIKH